MKKIVVSGLLALSLAAAVMPENEAAAGDPIGINPGGVQIATPITIGCEDPGALLGAPKRPVVKNTTGYTIKAGTVVRWTATDGDSGSIRLAADLPRNGTVQGYGVTSLPYLCNATFLTQADLVIKSATAAGPDVFSPYSVKVELQDLDEWVGAPASIVRLEVVACSGQVIRTINSQPIALVPGQTRSIAFPVEYPSGDRYLRVTADATNVVSERNKNNNVLDGQGVCAH